MARPTKDALPFSNGFAPHAANFVTKFIMHECSVPFIVYVETFLPCFLNMLWMITVPDINDLLRMQAEDMTPQAPGSKKPGRGHIRTYGTPRPIGKVESKSQQGLRHLLTVTEPLEKIGYMILLYHQTERFFYNWATLLNNFEHCGKPDSEGPLQRHQDEVQLTSNGTWQGLGLPFVDQNRANWATGNLNAALPRGHYSCTLEVTFRNHSASTLDFECGFETTFAIAFGNQSSGKISLGPGETGTVICHEEYYYPAITGGSIQWIRRSTAVPIGVTIKSAAVSIFSWQPGR